MRRAATIAVGALLASTPPASAASLPDGATRLSDERTSTVPAAVLRPAIVRAAPGRHARHLARLDAWTFHGSREVVVVLARVRADGRWWSLVRYPGLGERTGWMPSHALHRRAAVRTRLVVDRRTLTATLERDGRPWLRARIGVGAAGSPTPRGRFYVRERVRLAGGVYGARAFGLSAYSPFRTDWPGGGQVGVHGTNQPGLLPGRVSNGCVRLRDRDVIRLAERLPVGTPVVVR